MPYTSMHDNYNAGGDDVNGSRANNDDRRHEQVQNGRSQ